MAGALKCSPGSYSGLAEDASVRQPLTVVLAVGVLTTVGLIIGVGLYSHSNLPPYNTPEYNGLTGIEITRGKLEIFALGLAGMAAASAVMWLLLAGLIHLFGNAVPGVGEKRASFRQILHATGLAQTPRMGNFIAFLLFLGETPLMYLGGIVYLALAVWFLFSLLAAVRGTLTTGDSVLTVVTIAGWLGFMVVSTGLIILLALGLYIAGFSGYF